MTPPSAAEKLEAEAALRAFGRGAVEIAQKRIAPANGKKPGAFEYIAQRNAPTNCLWQSMGASNYAAMEGR